MPHAARLYQRCLCFAGIVAYVFFGLVIVVVNKSIVRDHGLQMPALVASMGALFTATLTRVLVLLGKVHVRPVGKQPWEFALWRVLPVGVCAAGSLCFGNMAYIFLDAGFIQMLKAGTPALLLLVLACLKVEVVSGKSAALALCMVAGSALASAQQPNATVVGLAVQLLSQICEVLQCTGMQVFLQQLGFDAWDAGYYLTPAVAACCLLPSILLEWPHIIADQKVQLLFDQAPKLVLSGCVGVVVNMSSLLVIKHTSSLLAKLLVIFRSAALVLVFILGGEEFTLLQVAGYAVTICAFVGYSVVKAQEAQERDSQQEDAAPDSKECEVCAGEPDLGLEAAPEAGASSLPRGISHTSNEGLLDEHRAAGEALGATPPDASRPSWDVTTFLFWFALFVFSAGAYQALVVRQLPSSELGLRGLVQAPQVASVSTAVPPAPDLASASGLGRGEPASAAAALGGAVGAPSLAGPPVVQTPAKVLRLADGRFLVHRGGEVALQARKPGSTFSSSWVVSSQDFGLVHLQALGGGPAARWLSCNLSLTAAAQDACELWMTASSWERWSPAEDVGEYVLKRRSTGLFLEADGPGLGWGQAGSTFRVADWLPEGCSLKGMGPSRSSYLEASGEIAFTMTTFSRVYARSAMFRQALSSAFLHLKERDFYPEFLVVDEWFEGPSLLAGTFSGPTVESTRAEMLDFFPGCTGATVEEAEAARGRCTFVFKDQDRPGQASSLNILLDLMRAKFWMHLEDDWVFYQDSTCTCRSSSRRCSETPTAAGAKRTGSVRPPVRRSGLGAARRWRPCAWRAASRRSRMPRARQRAQRWRGITCRPPCSTIPTCGSFWPTAASTTIRATAGAPSSRSGPRRGQRSR
ncbi:unnamed protein product [Prorocentrum cordatum]|uniref:Sugar phosphate transporter domain-containing protein n=1 Tax=Prorocentrum cordatum TaxID=2364126 RepID=A0ABN9VCS1_9DINO|nr:unnamed protein product [Polarella glacialis]